MKLGNAAGSDVGIYCCPCCCMYAETASMAPSCIRSGRTKRQCFSNSSEDMAGCAARSLAFNHCSAQSRTCGSRFIAVRAVCMLMGFTTNSLDRRLTLTLEWDVLRLRGRHRGDIGAQPNHVRCGKVSRHLLRHVSGCRPLGTALERCDKSDTTQSGNIVAHRGVEDPAFAVTQNHEHRLIVPRPLVCRIGICRR